MELWWKIRDFFNPKQGWLIEKIPDHYMCKQDIIMTTMFECLIHYVEVDNGLKSRLVDSEHSEFINQIVDDLEYCYEYIKNGRKELEEAADKAIPERINPTASFFVEERTTDGMWRMKSCEELYGMKYEEAFGEYNRLTELRKNTDTKVLKLIVDHRWFMD